MNKFYCFLCLFLSFELLAQEKLEFEKIIFNRDDTEISGLAMKGNELLFVGDKLSDRTIYKVRYEKDRFFSKPYLDLSTLNGHNSYFASALLLKHGGRMLKSPFDLEGIAYCGDVFYLANEQARHILKVTNNKIERLEIDFSDIFKKFGTKLEDIKTNAGFEGLTVDCENQTLYVAQERQPRAIIVVDLKTNSPTDIFTTPGEDEGRVGRDYTDLYFEKGHLYILERNFHLIQKLDPKTKKIVRTVSFGHTDKIHLKDTYKTGKPFGLAEGLTMDENSIYIGVDNNKKKLSKAAQEAYGLKGKFSSIIIYQRPKGF